MNVHRVRLREIPPFIRESLFKGEEFLFCTESIISKCVTGKVKRSYLVWDILYYLTWFIVLMVPPNVVLPIFTSSNWALFAIPLSMIPFFLGTYLLRPMASKHDSHFLALTNYRILQNLSFYGFDFVSLPYTNVEMREWKSDGLKFWFTPNRDLNGRRAHIQVSGLSEDEKRKIQKLFLEGKARDLSAFQPSTALTPNFEIEKEIGYLIQEHLPFLYYFKLSRISCPHPWINVFALGLSAVLLLIAAGPGVMMGLGMSGRPVWLPIVIIIAVWLLIMLLMMFSIKLHFAITEKGLLNIETGLRGTHIKTLGFDKVYPIYTERRDTKKVQFLYFSRTKSNWFQSFGGFELCGLQIIEREEIIFRKYLDTLKHTGADAV